MLTPNASQRAALERATTAYQATVAEAADYLLKRGLNEEIAEEARLGFVSEPVEESHEKYLGRLVIPYLTVSGVVGNKYRCIEHEDCKAEGCAKYLCEEGFHPRLFGVTSLLERSRVVAIAEGEVDALSARYLAGIPTVGAPGASSWQGFWSRLFGGYEEVIILADGDESGMKFARSIANGNGQIPPLDNARIVQMPDKEDVNSVIVAEGVDAFKGRLGL